MYLQVLLDNFTYGIKPFDNIFLLFCGEEGKLFHCKQLNRDTAWLWNSMAEEQLNGVIGQL